jgi:hypothetical protein
MCKDLVSFFDNKNLGWGDGASVQDREDLGLLEHLQR